MKKFIVMILAAAMATCGLSACGSQNSENSVENPSVTATQTTDQQAEASQEEDKKIKIVTTIFPEYDWVKEIVGDEISHVDLTMLLDNGVDLHSYQPTTEDIMKISDCDMFVYVGGESDEWVEDALKEAVNKDMQVINLLEVLKDTVKTEEAMPGMQAEEGHNHGYSHFADSDVQDRSLTDWSGEWQSVYPYLESGELDTVMERKAENGGKTAQEYKEYYETGYKTEVEKIVIDGENAPWNLRKTVSLRRLRMNIRGIRSTIMNLAAEEYDTSLRQLVDQRMLPNMCSSVIMELLLGKQSIFISMPATMDLMLYRRKWRTGQRTILRI